MIQSQARVALEVYKMFVQQTTKVMEFFELARSLQSVLQIEIPYIKHVIIINNNNNNNIYIYIYIYIFFFFFPQ